MRTYRRLIVLFLCSFTLHAQSITDKKSGLAPLSGNQQTFDQEALSDTNELIRQKRAELQELHDNAAWLVECGGEPERYRQLIERIRRVRSDMHEIEEEWREQNIQAEDDDYALWQQPEVSLEQLVVDYGSDDYVYLIPPDLADKKVSISSNLPIPRSSWSEMLSTILEQNGIGIQQINPFLRQLVASTEVTGGIQVTDCRSDLFLLPPTSPVAFVLRLNATDTHRLFAFMQRFSDESRVRMQLLGREVWMNGSVAAVQEILKLYDFAAAGHGDRDYRFVTLKNANAEEVAGILESIFGASRQKEGSFPLNTRSSPKGKNASAQLLQSLNAKQKSSSKNMSGLTVVTLSHASHALFLLGSQSELDKAEEIVQEVEDQLTEASRKTVYWYTARHSDPEDLATVAERVYALLLGADNNGSGILIDMDPNDPEVVNRGVPFYAGGLSVVNPSSVQPNLIDEEQVVTIRDNFIVDPKTNSIVMVVEAFLLNDIKDLLRRLDVPKKMVQIDVLLFEKSMTDRNRVGLNMLKAGDCAMQTDAGCVAWNPGGGMHDVNGILQLTLSQMKGSVLPAYDLGYNFLISQDDVQINASPSVTTMNRTPAKIAIVEEISINTGIVQIDTAETTNLANQYARAQYGITIQVTPTIHDCGDRTLSCDEDSYITLETDIVFDTIDDPSGNSRPNITRRNITNEVCVKDGETVILGGLRRKVLRDDHEAIPFLGEIPGIGKLFGSTQLVDQSTEMFMFLTPRIVECTSEALEKQRCESMRHRPGDSPELIRCQISAIEAERKRMFSEGIKMLFGRPCESTERVYWQYDGKDEDCCGAG